MKYILDISGHDEKANPGIKHFGGLFSSIDDAVVHGKLAVKNGRFWFQPETLWVRDQEGETVVRDRVD